MSESDSQELVEGNLKSQAYQAPDVGLGTSRHLTGIQEMELVMSGDVIAKRYNGRILLYSER